MEDKIIEYITGNGEQNTETIMPQNIDAKTFDTTLMFNYHTLLSNDGDYFIRYGGAHEGYRAIEVYSFNSLENNAPLYVFDNIQIAGQTVRMISLKQDEEGRFYGIGWKFTSSINEWFLILFNNFIQDGECTIRKYYNFNQIGITNIGVAPYINKKAGEANYYILSGGTNKIYSFKIDIVNGNKLDVYNYTYTGSLESANIVTQFYINNNNIIYMFLKRDEETNEIECGKLIIDTTKPIEDNYNTEILYTEQSADINAITVDEYNYKIIYKTPNNSEYNLKLKQIDLLGNSSIYDSSYMIPNFNRSTVFNKYVIAWDVDAQFIFLFVLKDNNLLHFKTLEMSANFAVPQLMNKYNLIYLVGLNSYSSIFVIKNTYSQNYSSIPYYNSNFLIPQYINLYGNKNDNKSVIFSRDISNRFFADNQLSVIYNVPNYMLNNAIVQRQDILGQTNQTIESDIKNLSKNRFESLYLNYIYSMYVTDNTNGNSLSNSGGANRVANAFWNALDFNNSKIAKARVTHEDGTQTILSLGTANITNNEATFEYEVSRRYK